MSEIPLNEFETFLFRQLQSYMKKHGCRMTSERMLVAKVIVRLASPFEVDEVFAEMGGAASQHRISRSTVFRMLRFFEEAGLLRCKKSENELLLYYHTISPQSDFLCEAVHAKLLAGTCPWCGRTIIEGKVQHDSE